MKELKNILITGGAGYVGTVLTELLLKHGYTVRVLDPVPEAVLHPIPFLNSEKFELMRKDIRKEKDVEKAVEGMDAVIHLAGIVGYPACEKEPKLSREINVEGTRNLVSAVNGRIPILFSSTTSVYGKIKGDTCTEKTTRNPLSNYGLQKAEAEDVIMSNKKYIIYRFTTGFGASIKMRFDTLPNDFTYKAIKDGKIVIYQKNFIRSFIHVKDMARAFLFGLEHFKEMNGKIYNVGNNDLNISKEELGLLVKKKTKCELEFKEIGKDLEGRDYYVSFDKIAKAGYKTTITMEAGIDELMKVINIL